MRGYLVFALAMIASINGHALPLSKEPDRLMYQVYVRAFFDSPKAPDGEGDFAGLEQKIAYLKDLGVGSVLLMPIFESTGDMGYIPRNYFQPDQAYGDIAQFRSLVVALHRADIKIVLDAPVNHISYDSPWFYRGSQKRCLPTG
jgi:glycosidase